MENVLHMNSTNKMYQIHKMIDKYTKVIYFHSSAGKLCEAMSHLVVIERLAFSQHSLLKWCRLGADLSLVNSYQGWVQAIYMLSEYGQQRGTKEVETVSLKSKSVFGQKHKHPFALICVLAPTLGFLKTKHQTQVMVS